MKKIIPYGRQYINEQDIQAVVDTLQSDFLTQGPRIKAFEEKFAEYIGADYAVAVSNGTAALHLCTLALNVDTHTRVITSPITFAASANCVRYCGGEVILSDIDPATALLDIEKVKNLLESKPKGYFSGIIPVDFAGYPVDLEAFRNLANQYDLWIIEDACHAPGAWHEDSKEIKQRAGNGTYADLAIFSFHPVKHIACGEGGMITTNRKDLYERLLRLRTHGISKNPDLLQENHGGWYYEMQELGYNYRLSDIHAALGISQIQRSAQTLKRRQEIAQIYNEAFANSPIQTIDASSSKISHAYHLYVIQVPHRKKLYDYLRQQNIFAQVHYIPIHYLPYYKQFGWKKGDFPKAEKYYDQCLSLPMYPTLSEEEQAYVIEKVLTWSTRHL